MFKVALSLVVALFATGVQAQSAPAPKKTPCEIKINFNAQVASVESRTGGSCEKGAPLSFRGYRLIPFFVEQACDLEKPVNKFNTEGDDPTYDRITCVYSGAIADPSNTYKGLSLVAK